MRFSHWLCGNFKLFSDDFFGGMPDTLASEVSTPEDVQGKEQIDILQSAQEDQGIQMKTKEVSHFKSIVYQHMISRKHRVRVLRKLALKTPEREILWPQKIYFLRYLRNPFKNQSIKNLEKS